MNLVETALELLAGDVRAAKVEKHKVIVRAARYEVEALFRSARLSSRAFSTIFC